MSTIFWHDYETFGTNPRADRPAQFAGVRTDEELNIIGDPVVLYCRPANDFLPHPEACLLTGISPQLALQKGLPEAEFTARIHAELAQPGTCGAGYNSIRFDDEFTRYLLYRNLYEPYSREWRNGNSRWDIIDLVRMAYALRPDGINWPKDEDGMPVFKLEQLTQANQLAHESAHDALSDVYATIALAKKIRQQQPRLYEFLFRLRDKKRAAEQLDLDKRSPVLHTSGMFPSKYGRTAMVVPLARDPVNANGVTVYDLRYDPEPLLELDAGVIRERVFSPANALPEGVERIPLKTVHLNKCPALAPLTTLPEDAEARLQISRGQSFKHLEKIHQVPARALEAKIQEALKPEQAFAPAPEAEAALYEGFIPNKDKAKLDHARHLSPQALADYTPGFQDTRLEDLLFRYRARNYPDTLNANELARWDAYRNKRLHDATAGGGMVLETYFQTIAKLRKETPPAKQGLLDDLEAYAREVGGLSPEKV